MSTRVVVFGYGPLALAALDALGRCGVTPAAVVVPVNRTGPDVDLVAARARRQAVPVLVQPRRSALEPFLESVRALCPDVLLVWSYSMLLPPELIAIAPKGAFNIHGGKLPDYRGGHVMNWAILNGEQESAATLHYIDAGIDTGDIVAEQRFPIELSDDAASVQEKLRTAGVALLEKWWPAIEQGIAPRTPQDAASARYYRMRTPDDGLVEWSQTSVQIQNLVRALAAPWPGAHTFAGDTKLVLRKVTVVESSDHAAAPGTVIRFEPGDVRVASGSGAMQIITAEIDGHEAGHAALRDAGLKQGVRLG
jgi:UDP-4-amino-4-deoxy-L-arabinose formyltransferase/UDP-glucuronic acid dehydrogenase (UDP-4-keto-hexauronic acid decarboxylating)